MMKVYQKAKNKSRDLTNIKLLHMDAQNLDFEGEIFDHIIGTFVMCSIPDPVRALKEAKRVLKKDGEIILIEHVLSKNRFIAILEKLHNPLTSRIFGFNVNRDTRQNIIDARLNIISDEKLAFFDVFRRFIIRKH